MSFYSVDLTAELNQNNIERVVSKCVKCQEALKWIKIWNRKRESSCECLTSQLLKVFLNTTSYRKLYMCYLIFVLQLRYQLLLHFCECLKTLESIYQEGNFLFCYHDSALVRWIIGFLYKRNEVWINLLYFS